MTKTMFALSLGFAGLILATRAGFAAPACAVHETVVAYLGTTHQETRKGIGLVRNNGIVEVFASDTGTWTIAVTMPSGVTCMIASGRNWVVLPEGDPA